MKTTNSASHDSPTSIFTKLFLGALDVLSLWIRFLVLKTGGLPAFMADDNLNHLSDEDRDTIASYIGCMGAGHHIESTSNTGGVHLTEQVLRYYITPVQFGVR